MWPTPPQAKHRRGGLYSEVNDVEIWPDLQHQQQITVLKFWLFQIKALFECFATDWFATAISAFASTRAGRKELRDRAHLHFLEKSKIKFDFQKSICYSFV